MLNWIESPLTLNQIPLSCSGLLLFSASMNSETENVSPFPYFRYLVHAGVLLLGKKFLLMS